MDENQDTKTVEQKQIEERTYAEAFARLPKTSWVIAIVCSVLGTITLFIPPIGLCVLGLGFAALWLPAYSWKNEAIRAPFPSGKITHKKLMQDLRLHNPRCTIKTPADYSIVEDRVECTHVSTGDDYTPTTITFAGSGTFKIRPSRFQKYYSPAEIAFAIKNGEGVYLIFSKKTGNLVFVYRKKYCSL